MSKKINLSFPLKLKKNKFCFQGNISQLPSLAEQEAEGRRKIPQKATQCIDPGKISALPVFRKSLY